MTKVAVCFSGQPRSLNLSIPSLKKYLIDQYDCDIFISTWMNYNSDYRKEGHVGKFEGTNLVGNGTPAKWSLDEYTYLQKELKPKILNIEAERSFLKTYKIPDWSLGTTSIAIQGMFYTMDMCNQLKNIYQDQTNTHYDIVIKLRLDSFLHQTIDLTKFDVTFINVSNITHKIGYNDFCAIGNNQNMNIYCSIYRYLDSLYENGIAFNPEILIAEYLRLKNIKVKVNTEIKHEFPCIIRNNGIVINN